MRNGIFAVEIGLSPTTFTATVDSAHVPEPGTMVLLGAGLLILAIFSKRRQS